MGEGQAHLLRIRKHTMTDTKITRKPISNKPRKARQPVAHRVTDAIPSSDDLPDSALVRLPQLIRDPKRPNLPTPLPFSAATLWRKVRSQSFPAPTKLSDAITAWKVGDVRAWLRAQAAA